MNPIAKILLIAAATFCAAGVQAQSAGAWLVQGGVTRIQPNVSSGDVTAPSFPHTQVAVDGSTRLSGDVIYMLSDHLAVDLPLALPFRHRISGDGAIAGVGRLGDVKSLPVTLLGQWRFMAPNAKLRPYVGAGLTYAKLYGARTTSTLSAITGGSPRDPTTLAVESKWAPTFQLGATLALNERWYVDVSASYTLLKTHASLSTGQVLDIKLNPGAASLALGYKF